MSLEGAAEALRDALDELARGGEALRARSRSSIASSLANAWERIADPERALGRAARTRVPESSGLTLPMVAWGLSTTLGDAREALGSLAAQMEPPLGTLEAPPRLGALVLAGNVFTACVQPLSIALLARVPVLVKASSADDAMPRLFEEALEAVDPELAGACLVVSLPAGRRRSRTPSSTAPTCSACTAETRRWRRCARARGRARRSWATGTASGSAG